MSSPRQLAVIDIDGVLADVRHRLHFVLDEAPEEHATLREAQESEGRT